MGRLLAPLALAVAALGLASAGANAAEPPACRTLAPAIAAAALGAPATAMPLARRGDGVACAYRSAGASQRFTLVTFALDSEEEAKSEFAQMIADPAHAAVPAEALAGIGIAAQRLGPSVYVLNRRSVYVFALSGTDPKGAGAARMIAAVRRNAARLP